MGEYDFNPELAVKQAEAQIKAEFEAMRRNPLVMVPHSLGAGGGVGKAAYGYPLHTPPRVYSLREKLEMRMNWQPSVNIVGFSHMDLHSVGDKAFIWIVTNDGQSVVLEDEAALFPSDALITKVRMMGG